VRNYYRGSVDGPQGPCDCTTMQRRATRGDAGNDHTIVVVDGVSYVPAAEVAERAGIARQTLWRWRRAGKVPAGYVYRDNQVLFTIAEAASVDAYARRMHPAEVERSSLKRKPRP
jgi:transcriptional regulator with XRE-family HTH domain